MELRAEALRKSEDIVHKLPGQLTNSTVTVMIPRCDSDGAYQPVRHTIFDTRVLLSLRLNGMVGATNN